MGGSEWGIYGKLLLHIYLNSFNSLHIFNSLHTCADRGGAKSSQNWSTEDLNESAPQVSQLSASVPNKIFISQITSVLVQKVSLVQASTLNLTVITSITSPPMDLTFCSFTPEWTITSFQNTSSLQSSSHFN